MLHVDLDAVLITCWNIGIKIFRWICFLSLSGYSVQWSIQVCQRHPLLVWILRQSKGMIGSTSLFCLLLFKILAWRAYTDWWGVEGSNVVISALSSLKRLNTVFLCLQGLYVFSWLGLLIWQLSAWFAKLLNIPSCFFYLSHCWNRRGGSIAKCAQELNLALQEVSRA